MDPELDNLLLGALPADMDHRIDFSEILRRIRLIVPHLDYVVTSDALDALVKAGRVASWEGDPDDRSRTYSLPQAWEDPDADIRAVSAERDALHARCFAVESENARLRVAFGRILNMLGGEMTAARSMGDHAAIAVLTRLIEGADDVD